MDRPSRPYTGTVPRVGAEKRSGQRRKLLIIDDDRAFIVLAAAILRDAGFLVLEAHDARQGYLDARQDPPDIILLDMQMPAGGGMNVLEQVQTIPRLQQVPIVVITASTDESLDASVTAKGALGVLRKPIDRDRLLALVNSILEQAPPQS